MPNRNPNNPNTDPVVLAAIKVVAPGYPTPNTTLLAANIYIQDVDALQSPDASFPALLLESGEESHTRIGEEYQGELPVVATYFDRWDTQTQTFAQIWANIDADLNLVMANLQDNPSLSYGGYTYTTTISRFKFSSYKEAIDKETVPGLVLVKRSLSMIVDLLPYDA
jgi:hypothetical protein